jgi:hypothetical protein
MNLEQIAGVLILIGAALFVIAMLISPPLYQEPDIDKREQIVKARRGRWNVSQIFFGLGVLVPAIGFLLLTIHLHRSQSHWSIYPGMAALLTGAVAGTAFVYLQTLDPGRYWRHSGPVALIVVYVVLTLGALIFYGIAFGQADLPNWLGPLVIGTAGVLLAAFFVTRAAAFALVVVSYFVYIAIGIVLVI